MSSILLPDDMARSVFEYLDFATVVQFVLTSKQSRKDATKFVTRIDMWRLAKFPIDLMMKSVGYIIGDVPSEALRSITAVRMPIEAFEEEIPHVSAEYKSSWWNYLDPVLCHLTSLHALCLSHDDSAGLPSVLRRCTSLRQLHFHGTTVRPIEDYLASQPRLDGIAVSLMSTEQGDVVPVWRIFEVVRLIKMLDHRPKVISLGPRQYHMDQISCPGWARGAEAVVLGTVARLSGDSDQVFVTKLETALGVPLERCWSIEKWDLDPLCPDDRTLPLFARVWVEQGRPLDYAPAFQGMPFHRAAETAHYLLQHGQQLPESLLHVIADIKTEADWIWAVAAQRGESRNQKAEQDVILSDVKDLNTMYKPLETILWAIKRMKSITVDTACDARLSSILRSMFPLDAHQVLLTGNRCYDAAVIARDEVRRSTDKEMIFRLWNTFPGHTAETIEERKILTLPDDFPMKVSLTPDSASYVASAGCVPTFRCNPTALIQNPQVRYFLLRWFTIHNCQQILTPIDGLLRVAATTPEFVTSLHRHVRVFGLWQGAACAMYGSPFDFDAMPMWQELKADIDSHLTVEDLLTIATRACFPKGLLFGKIAHTQRLPQQLIRDFFERINAPDLGLQKHMISSSSLSCLSLMTSPDHAALLEEIDASRVRDLVLCGFPDGWERDEAYLSKIVDIVVPPLEKFLRLILPPIWGEFARLFSDTIGKQWAEMFQKCYDIGDGRLLIDLFAVSPKVFVAVAKSLRMWENLARLRRYEVMSIIISDSAMLRHLTAGGVFVVNRDTAIQIALSPGAPLKLVVLALANVAFDAITTSTDIMNVLYKRFKNEMTSASSASLPDKVALWLFTAGGILRISDNTQYVTFLRIYDTWSQPRIKFMLKQGSHLLSAAFNMSIAIEDQDSQGRMQLLRKMTLFQLNMLAVKQNWDGFLTTAVSYQTLFSSSKALDFGPIINMLLRA
eukprot:TRINITY_DN2431_c0_g2_i1.p1 TRINITY_DN2431_c0_g2~~TRINITY_DN2431_c0_g2_i1.p1  ORF type:complete len:958 (+),score=112.74 TRINITY_DN2431_c0_g2_i1:312-3185(+)